MKLETGGETGIKLQRSASKQMSSKKLAIIIFILALAVRFVHMLVVTHAPLVHDAKEYDALGFSLSQGNGYVNSLGKQTAFRPPIYPLFLGLIYYIAGHDLFWVRLMQAILGAGICVLAYLIARVIFDETTASLCGLLCCLYPPLFVSTSEIMTETLFTFLLLLGLVMVILKNSHVNLMMSGLIFGLALLTRPFVVFFAPFFFYWILSNEKYDTRKAIVILATSILLIMSPWAIRNYYRLGSFVPFANVGGVTFYNSYVVPSKGFGFNSLEGVGTEYYDIKDETEQNRYLIRKTIEYVAGNPVKAVRLTLTKLLLFVYPFDGNWYSVSFGSKYNVFWGIILWFSVIGIVINLGDNDINKRLIYFLFVSFLAGSVVFYGSPRFRFPIEPLLICFAASGLIRLTKKNVFASTAIVGINVVLFAAFRYFRLEELFNLMRKWM